MEFAEGWKGGHSSSICLLLEGWGRWMDGGLRWGWGVSGNKGDGGDFDLRQTDRPRAKEGERERGREWRGSGCLAAGATVEEGQGGLETSPLKLFNPHFHERHQARKTLRESASFPNRPHFGF